MMLQKPRNLAAQIGLSLSRFQFAIDNGPAGGTGKGT
jgi:hypothetical protein